ncbi:MAG TPA: hypothetical protein VIY90_07015 [Steroidobacteraceae bacterium]
MSPVPPEAVERVLRMLVPPASREDVMGDLHERYLSRWQYLADALRTVPFVLASRIRRTCNLPLMIVLALYLQFVVFQGNTRQPGPTATLPTVLAMLALVLRDVYRTPTPTWPRQAALDVLTVAVTVALGETVLALIAPQFLLSRSQMMVVFPTGCAQLFYVRLQIPTGVEWPPPIARAMSLDQLLTEIRGFERRWRAVIGIETVFGLLMAVCCLIALWQAHGWLNRSGFALAAVGLATLTWLLATRARVRPLPPGIGFAQSLAIYRRNLEHRTWLATRYLRWYVLPTVPGSVLLVIALASHRADALQYVARFLAVGVAIIVFMMQLQNSVRAKYQRRAEQLNLVTELR